MIQTVFEPPHTHQSNTSLLSLLDFSFLEEFLLSQQSFPMLMCEPIKKKDKEHKQNSVYNEDFIHQFLCRHLPPPVSVVLKLALHH